MKNLKIAFRLGIGFGLVTLLMCVLGYSAYTALEQSAASIKRINHTYIPILHTAAMLRDAVRVADADMQQYEVIGKQEDYSKAQAALAPVPEGFDRLRALAADLPGLQALQVVVREAPPLFEQYRQSSKDTAAVVDKINGLFDNLIALAGKSETAMQNLEAALFSQREALSAAGNTAALKDVMESMSLLSRVQLSFKETRRMVTVARLNHDQAALNTMVELANTGLNSLNELGKTLDEPRLKTVSQTAIGAMRDYIGSMDSLFQGWQERGKANANRHTLEQQLTAQLDSLNEAVTAEADAFTKATVTASSDVRDQVSMGFAFGAVLALVLAFVITRSITVPLNRSMAFAQDIAAGYLDHTLNVHSRDEIGKLADALRTLPLVLGNVISEYREIERRVGEGHLGTKGDPHKFSGEFAQLIDGTNAVLARFITLMEQLPTAVVVLDSKLNATYLNFMARKLAGDDFMGKSCGELFHREDYGSATDGLQIAVRSKQPSGGETVAHPRAGTLDVSYKVTPFMDAKGNLTSVLQLITDITALQKARQTILNVANEASGISVGVASTAQHLSKQVSQSEQSVGVTSDRIAETATAMEEMNSTVLEVARNSAAAADVANEAKNKAEHGSRVVSDVIAHIGQMEKQAGRMKEDMVQLGSHADAIGAIMTVISDIADQTNLLALNAAIEAARAGDAGRGFAVVADEVRKLAEKTMHATVEVASTIKSVQTSADQNRHNVDESGRIIVQVIELTRQAGESLREIVLLVENSSMQAQAIATAAEEQSAASEEINHSLTAVNTAASQTAEAMTQAAQAVDDLSTQAQNLAQLIEEMRKV